MKLLAGATRGLGAAPEFANKGRSQIPGKSVRVASAIARNSQAGDRICPPWTNHGNDQDEPRKRLSLSRSPCPR